jgi:hypothetical protein
MITNYLPFTFLHIHNMEHIPQDIGNPWNESLVVLPVLSSWWFYRFVNNLCVVSHHGELTMAFISIIKQGKQLPQTLPQSFLMTLANVSRAFGMGGNNIVITYNASVHTFMCWVTQGRSWQIELRCVEKPF